MPRWTAFLFRDEIGSRQSRGTAWPSVLHRGCVLRLTAAIADTFHAYRKAYDNGGSRLALGTRVPVPHAVPYTETGNETREAENRNHHFCIVRCIETGHGFVAFSIARSPGEARRRSARSRPRRTAPRTPLVRYYIVYSVPQLIFNIQSAPESG